MTKELIAEAKRQWMHADWFCWGPYCTLPNPRTPDYFYRCYHK